MSTLTTRDNSCPPGLRRDQRWWLLAACALRFFMGLVVYQLAWQVAPSNPLPVLNTWLLANDANQYHVLAKRMATFWAGHSATLSLGLPDRFLGYPVVLGWVYFLLGPHPLWGVLLNCLAFLGVGLLAHRLALRLGHPPGLALTLTLLVVLWPPSLAYSSALLKDSLTLLTVFLLLTTLADLLAPSERLVKAQAIGWECLGLLAGTYGLVVLRPDFTLVVAFVALGASAWSALGRLSGRHWRPWLPLAAGLLVTLGIFLGISRSPVRLLPANTLTPSPAPSRSAPTRLSEAPVASSRADSPAFSAQLTQLAKAGLEQIWQRRWKYAQSGGVSLVPEANVLSDGPESLAVIVGASLRNLLLYPLPWQRWPSGSGRLVISLAVTSQSLLWYVLLPGLAWGMVEALRRRPTACPPVVLWVAVVGPLLALMIVNLGTLYRIRDLVLLPSLLLLSGAPYRWVWGKLLRTQKVVVDSGALPCWHWIALQTIGTTSRKTYINEAPSLTTIVCCRKGVALALILALFSVGALLVCMAAKPRVSPLFAAVESRNPAYLAATLRTNLGEIDRKYFGRSPLILAVVNNRADMAEMLLAAGADINTIDAYGNTPLHTAVFCHRAEVVSLLLERGAGVNSRNRFGSTPLHVAAFIDAQDIIMQMLMAHGADRSALDNRGRTAAALALCRPRLH